MTKSPVKFAGLSEEWCQTAALTLVRMEEKQDAADERAKEMASDLKMLSVAVMGNGHPEESLMARVDTHLKLTHVGNIIKSWRTWIFALLAIVTSHELMERFGSPFITWALALLKIPPINLG